MIDYMLIQANSSKVKLRTIGSTKPYLIRLGNDSVVIDEAYERWLVYHVYSYGIGNISYGLRQAGYQFSPDEFDEFVEQLQADHPPIPIDGYTIQQTPLIATKDACLTLMLTDLYSYPIKMTMAQEQDLLNLMFSDIVGREDAILRWFAKFRERYGIDTKKKKDQRVQDLLLAEDFCVMHGLSYQRICRMRVPKPSIDKSKLKWWQKEEFALWIVAGVWIGYVSVCVLIAWIGVFLFDNVNIIVGGLVLLASFVGMFYPFYKIVHTDFDKIRKWHQQ